MTKKIIKIYDVEKYLPLKVIEDLTVKKTVFKYKAIKKKSILSNRVIDYIEQNKINQELGYWGEAFVFNYERKCVKKYNLSEEKQVIWVSKDEGDGLGYDILSYDSEGNEKYIEVKTTVGGEKTSFYITANELMKSEEVKEQYFLYRVYDFDMKKKHGKLSVKNGSLKEFCIMPQVYKVELE